MNYLGISFPMQRTPELDPGFIPFGIWRKAYLENATKPIAIAVERNGDIVFKSQYAETVLKDGDSLEIVSFVGGG